MKNFPPLPKGLSPLGKWRKESAKRRPERAERAGASESLGRGEWEGSVISTDACPFADSSHIWKTIPAHASARLILSLLCVLFVFESRAADPAAPRTFPARGVVLELKPDTAQLVIQHEAIADYMDAMTMPFNLKDRAPLSELKRGDQVTFELHITADESWADHFQKIGAVSLPEKQTESEPGKTVAHHADKSLLDYKFTNELGQAVSFNDFRGQALAITFFYTRCPVPDFCPRLSMNFKEASQKLRATTSAPTNWHFISVSFDPRSDTPEVLQSYGRRYNYDPSHWSFFTGPMDKIAELARDSGVTTEAEVGTINHNFRTLIIDPQGHLQMIFPTSGNISDQIVTEILKATAEK